MNDWRKRPHRRFNPLTGEWILVSPHRLDRPWLGEVAQQAPLARPAYDPACYLCPGNERAGGVQNPQYTATFAFDNDYPALVSDAGDERFEEGPLRAQAEPGQCRVLCFSPRHDLDVAQMDTAQIRLVIDAWASQYTALAERPFVNAVTIFENRGAMMGASNPHPHCQIWAQRTPPNELAAETQTQGAHLRRAGRCLLCEYAAFESAAQERIVYENEHVCVIVPFWATWPFEALVLSRRHAGALPAYADEERDAMSEALHALTSRYDRLFSAPFPYSMGWHQTPPDGEAHEEWHAHAHYYPPLLRSAAVRKFMVGYEMLGEPQRDVPPEEAARMLRDA